MLKRPLLLKLFALFLFIDPLLRIIFISIEREFSVATVVSKTFALGPLDMFNFWFLFPICGVLVLSVKVYSYLLFIIIQFYSLYFHLNYEPFAWPYLSKTPSIMSYLLLTINLFIMIYLLFPRSRELFFDKNLRWWERGSRYTINEPCFIFVGDKEVNGKVVDLSHGGALLDIHSEIEEGQSIKLNFDITNTNISLNANIKRKVIKEGKVLYGVQFDFDSFLTKLQLKFLMISIAKLSNYEKYR